MKTIKEIWKDIPNYEGINQVSNYGRIRSLDRYTEYTSVSKNGVVANVRRFVKGRARSVYADKFGYAVVILCGKGNNNYVRVARLVGAEFLPPPTDEQTQINHIDGVPLNNHIDNLEWCTPQENLQHASETGLLRNRNTSRVLNMKSAAAIKLLYKTGNFSQWELADMMGVSQSHINNLLNGRTWKDA